MTARCLFALAFAVAWPLAQAAPLEEPPPTPLKLVPAAEPVPSLRFRLLPELREQTSGNALTGYYRAYSPDWQWYRREMMQEDGPVEKAIKAPLAELRGSELAKKIEWIRDSAMLREIDRAARRSYCDWELTDRLREDGVGLLLPDLQGLRSFAQLVALRARLAMADGQFDSAAHSIATGYALARHAGEGPTLIHGLVSMAIANIMNKQVETWVQAPGSPNLYWALTDLPVSFIDLRKGIQGERLWMDNLFPQLRESLKDPARPPFSPQQMRESLGKIAKVVRGESNEEMPFDLLFVAAKYGDAKKFLGGHGWTAAQIEAMTSMQAVLMQELFEYDRLFDLVTRAANLPYLQGFAAMQDAEQQLKKATELSLLQAPVLAKLLLPATSRVIVARTRLDRQIAALRTIEAIRMYAAANIGKLPEKLEAMTAVPMPLDPATGKTFLYTLRGGQATLSANVLPEDSVRNTMRYALTIVK